MGRDLLTAAAIAASSALWAAGGAGRYYQFADHNGAERPITYTGNGAGSVTVAIPATAGPAFDNVNAGLGTYTLSAVTFAAGPGPNLFPASATELKTYTNGADTLSATITWNLLQDGTPQPRLFGTETITSIAGSAAFLGGFGPIGSVLGVDFTSQILSYAVAANCATTNALSLTTASATAAISSGEEVVGGVPEPASLALLGAGSPDWVCFGRRAARPLSRNPDISGLKRRPRAPFF
jgi:hypothetical protein